MANQERHDGETIILIDVMSKRSQDKGVLASIIGSNFKERLFILTQSRLYYYEGNLEVRFSFISTWLYISLVII